MVLVTMSQLKVVSPTAGVAEINNFGGVRKLKKKLEK